MTIAITFPEQPSLDLFAFPFSKAGVAVGALNNWNAIRVPITRAAAPNNGRYSVNLDPSIADVWLVFINDVQPTSFDEAIREISEVALAASGTGQHAIAITVKTGATTPVHGAKVTVSKSGTIVAWGYTSQLGQLSFALDPDTYTVNVTGPGFTALVNQSLVVTAPANATYTLTPIAITPPPTSGLCRIAVSVVKSSATVPGAEVTADLVDKQSTIRAGISVLIVDNATTDEDGYCELLLPWTSEFTAGTGFYRIRAKASGGNSGFHERYVTIPDLATANYADLPTAQTE